MLRRLLLLSCTVSFLAPLPAQFSQAENFSVGDQARYLSGTWDAGDPGKSGKNITWNFTYLTAQMDTGVQQIRSAGDTYLPAGLGPCNMVECNDDSSFVFLKKTVDTLFMTGYRDANARLTMVYDRPIPFMVWPLSTGNRMECSAGRKYTVGGIPYIGTGTFSTEVDGAGTLKLPGHEYTDVIRVCFRQVFTDKDQVYGSVSTITVTSYTWFDKTHKHAVFKLDRMKVESAYYNQETQSFKILIP